VSAADPSAGVQAAVSRPSAELVELEGTDKDFLAIAQLSLRPPGCPCDAL